jgi:ribA/ribD-fused uncharacterized protein
MAAEVHLPSNQPLENPAMSLFDPPKADDALLINRLDPGETLGCAIERPFDLDGHHWLTAEHYYQAMKYPGKARFEDILNSPTAAEARKHGRGWLKRTREDWSGIRTLVMTRAIYTQARTHDGFAQAILATGEQPIRENSLYDYFWGTGRDQRGDNAYGTVMMNVRDKLREEAS